MLTFISDMVVPNFIPINESATRPDVLYAVFTPDKDRMRRKLDSLKDVFDKNRLGIELVEVPIDDELDSKAIYDLCNSLLDKHKDDEWTLNATLGTKLMAASAHDCFRSRNHSVIYVDSQRERILRINPDWSQEAIPFGGSMSLTTFFALHGQVAISGESQTNQEREVCRQLGKLDWDVYPSVSLPRSDDHELSLVEYDVVCIRGYNVSVFECSRLSVNERNWTEKLLRYKEVDQKIFKDISKLTQIRNAFGGNFSSVYWIKSGNARIRESNLQRMKLFRIQLISGREIELLEEEKIRTKFRLPGLKSNRGKVAVQ